MIVRRIANDEFEGLGPRLAELERGVSYPLGDDRFEIDHGKDYFAFFRRLRGGSARLPREDDLRYYVAEQNRELFGILAAVRRTYPTSEGLRDAWYLCDLKRSKRHGIAGVARPLLEAFKADSFATERRAFGISMLRSDGSSPLLRFARGELSGPESVRTRLRVYRLDARAMRRVEPVLSRRFGAISYLSLEGVKDLVLQSSGRPFGLRHVQYGPFSVPSDPAPVEGAAHMFCLPADDRAVAELAAAGVSCEAFAMLLGRGVADLDPAAIQTSDI